ncbi:MAG: VOC family protein [Planctomycetaceae bacterium]
MTAIAFSHIALNCRDMAATERFYSRHFGFRRARVIDLGADQILFLKSGNVYLELFRATECAPVAAPEKDGHGWQGIRHLAFQVEDVAATLAEIGADAEPTLGPLEFDAFIPGWKTVWVRDPDGNIVEISQGFVDQINPPAAELQESLASV